jgi:hypothetical protein
MRKFCKRGRSFRWRSAYRAKHPRSLSIPIAKNIPLYRNSVLSYVSPIPAHQRGGRTSSRNAGWVAVDAGGVDAGSGVQGEMNLVSASRTAHDERRRSPAKPLGEAGLLAYGETVWSWPSLLRSSFCEGVIAPTGARSVSFAEVTEARRNSSPGRARHRPSNHCAGKAWFRLPCVSPVHRVRNHFA